MSHGYSEVEAGLAAETEARREEIEKQCTALTKEGDEIENRIVTTQIEITALRASLDQLTLRKSQLDVLKAVLQEEERFYGGSDVSIEAQKERHQGQINDAKELELKLKELAEACRVQREIRLTRESHIRSTLSEFGLDDITLLFGDAAKVPGEEEHDWLKRMTVPSLMHILEVQPSSHTRTFQTN